MKALIVTLIIILGIKADVGATSIYASSFGWNLNDATSAFQAAITSPADTIIIDKQPGDWVVGPNRFFDLADKTIVFQPGVVLRAKANAFINTGDCLLSFVRANHIRIIGYGATFKMNKAEYAALADGEYRHSLSISNSSNMQVYGLKIDESGGDGVFISGDTWYGTQLHSENILLKDLWSDKNYRQGISIISAQHVLVQNCWFTNTSGTLPMSGVDLEPDKDFHRMADVVFEKCRFTGNFGNGIQLSFHLLTDASIPVDVTFRDCYSSNNHDVSNSYTAAEINISAAARQAVTGSVKFERCLVENSQWSAVSMRKTADSFLASFDDCVFLNVSKDITNFYNTPIWIEVTDYSNPSPRFGGANFNDCLLSYTTNLNLLGSYGDIDTSPGMGNVQLNNLTVIHPNPAVDINVTDGGGSPDASCRFDFHKFITTPATMVSFTAENSILGCPEKISILKSERTADNVTFPMAVSYAIDGTALQGEDYHRMNGFMIIPSNSLSEKDTISLVDNEYSDEIKNITLMLDTSPLFTPTSIPQTITLTDCVTGLDESAQEELFTIFPNPASDFLVVELTDDYRGAIEVMNEVGQLMRSQKLQEKVNRIDIRGLSKGMYFIKITLKDQCYLQKIIVI
jgi:Secretion system C-terminal sorting domain